ncbi:PEP-CTERM sorting domain-containing protein [Sphingomonas sp. KR1UV-12]|uniref:PEP-CTERM sorting domain-containing protein n=1 Tax=Sphingomonas aurea TaxID=3063994 RepID=A0ABT9EN62_9SPHN|nr:PEP-CTERM sorting domain-containing protein [Sphingomonas sp. KR1UV-12]MDP1028398.1 PEP-CTERM sorting domain-containing protein [Sphingomonas sp. KR1UV-12]
MIKLLPALAARLIAACALAVAPAQAKTILFVGNSFTFGANAPVRVLNADQVTDLNGERIGGVPGLFKRFAEQAGLDWQVSLETAPGRTLGWHLAERRERIDRAWDQVVLQEYSTLDPARPGDGAAFAADARRLAQLFRARNPRVALTLTATWTRPDLVFRPDKRWSGTPIQTMADDLRRATDQAAAGARAKVAPVGQAFTCAIRAGVADANPYNGIDFGRVPLWSYDHYHASSYGYYLEALVVFAQVTGVDPRALGPTERAADELGFSQAETVALQKAAHDAIATDGGCGR